MRDDDEAPTAWAERLFHPFTISAVILAVLVAIYAIYQRRERQLREIQDAALEPLERTWTDLSQQARAHLVRAQEALAAAPNNRAECAGLSGVVGVIDRRLLDALAAGEVAPRPNGPLWLSSDVWQSVALIRTPGREPALHFRRNERVREELERPCLAVLDVAVADHARPTEPNRFEGGTVAGRLRVVCLGDTRVACEVEVASAPLVAVSVEQRDPRGQASADRMAVDGSAERSYWKAVAAALAAASPGLGVVPPDE